MSKALPTSDDESMIRQSPRAYPVVVGLPIIPVDESIDSPSTGILAAQASTSPSFTLSGQPSSSSLTEDQRSERPPLSTSSSSCSPSSSILSSHHSSSPPSHTDQQPSKEESFEEPPSCSLPVESALLPDGHTLCVGDVVWGR